MKKIIKLRIGIRFFLFIFCASIAVLSKAQCPINDPAFESFTGFEGIVPYSVHNVEEAWECTCGDEEISVAVIGHFQTYIHEEFQGKIVELFGPISNDFGTECIDAIVASGIIAAIPNNNIAVAGVAYDTKVGFFSIASTCDEDEVGYFAAFQEAVSNGYKIINSTSMFAISDEDQEQILSDFLDSGGLLVIGGNSDAHVFYADWPGVINVGGMVSADTDDEYVYQPIVSADEDLPVDICVLLEDMEGLSLLDLWGFTDNNLAANAAMVSATAALMLAVNDTLTGAEIEVIIRESGQGEVLNVPENSNNSFLDIGAAVMGAKAFGVINNVHVTEHNHVTIYPNPSSDFINLEAEYDNISIVSMNGEVIYQAGRTDRIDISHLAIGKYFLRGDQTILGSFQKVE